MDADRDNQRQDHVQARGSELSATNVGDAHDDGFTLRVYLVGIFTFVGAPRTPTPTGGYIELHALAPATGPAAPHRGNGAEHEHVSEHDIRLALALGSTESSPGECPPEWPFTSLKGCELTIGRLSGGDEVQLPDVLDVSAALQADVPTKFVTCHPSDTTIRDSLAARVTLRAGRCTGYGETLICELVGNVPPTPVRLTSVVCWTIQCGTIDDVEIALDGQSILPRLRAAWADGAPSLDVAIYHLPECEFPPHCKPSTESHFPAHYQVLNHTNVQVTTRCPRGSTKERQEPTAVPSHILRKIRGGSPATCMDGRAQLAEESAWS